MTGFDHLRSTFEAAERSHRDVMEQYTVLLAQEDLTSVEKISIMRAGLRETFRARFPMPEGVPWPKAEVVQEAVAS